jgi:hypothetical protein
MAVMAMKQTVKDSKHFIMGWTSRSSGPRGALAAILSLGRALSYLASANRSKQPSGVAVAKAAAAG